MGVGRGIEEEVKEMGDDDDEWGEAVQEAEEPRGTDASMREVQGLVDGDVHMVDEEREEHHGMDVDALAPREDLDLTKIKMTRRKCTACGQVPAQLRFILREEISRYHIIINLSPRLLNPRQGRVR